MGGIEVLTVSLTPAKEESLPLSVEAKEIQLKQSLSRSSSSHTILSKFNQKSSKQPNDEATVETHKNINAKEEAKK